jgi:(E)-4-hydroxy-3-methylbut-2-enyl-diphosphate synthase
MTFLPQTESLCQNPDTIPIPKCDNAPMTTPCTRDRTHRVQVGCVAIGGGAPVVVQAMTDTDTVDAAATAAQCLVLHRAGAELVRITVATGGAAEAVPEIRGRLDDAGCGVGLIGDFHYNAHLLLEQHPGCARSLDKYRINPGNVGTGSRRDSNFAAVCAVARNLGKPIRIGVNSGSLDSELLTRMMRDNAALERPRRSAEVFGDCMVASAVESAALAIDCGLDEGQIVLSCKVSSPPELVRIYRELARRTRQPLHLGLTEAGIGSKGLVWSASAMGILLNEGIGDTIRISLTPSPGGDRTEEVHAACELLQGLGIRSFAPSVIACPGCGRTTSIAFQELADRVQRHLRDRLPHWRGNRPGIETFQVAVMGCVVNGPGESARADVGISLPGSGESPRCPVYIDGVLAATLQGDHAEVAERFIEIIEDYVEEHFPARGDS